ncbi:protein-L-isoaspartate(D-aspartate) O-methyltransferase [Halocatena pleomorpha]|uniref:Protein-L-isoaspartate O-methyltransferase n=1 Tax=Halocatena pleomorpha TaxID=1785090 RepID=A0A3P3R8I1_9EURY|nr:protein-L-isoaspartate(D-aspartate) O-methyltransferase [Halocatena pleomorpha]RRJ28950.1 protein-L-isoaspartate(D-aspartate) O-methyltransferase [Halocatena pleomorpha]
MSHENDRERLVEVLSRSDRVHRASVLEAIGTVPRHEFVPDNQTQQAYHDRPLPIGHGQTISAPHMVAIMTDRLALSPEDRVLEIGTGCGYHAAVVAEIVDTPVYSVEYQAELAESAQQRLDRLGYDVTVTTGDGRDGWPEHAPYDAAYLTCATPELPDPVIEQLATGGRIVAPVGTRRQQLIVAEKEADGSLTRRTDGYVQFVPMRG